MSQPDLRQQIEKIYDCYGRQKITREEFYEYLEKQGLTEQEIKQLLNTAIKNKIILVGFRPQFDENWNLQDVTITLQLMTEEDWEIIEAVEKETEREEELKRILHKEPTEEEIKKILKELNPE